MRACAKTSFQQAQEDILTFMGISVGHSTLHRLVGRVELPLAENTTESEEISIDGGKLCLCGEEKEGSL